MKRTDEIAILLFSNTYVKEHHVKKILPSISENKLLFKTLFDKTIKEIRKTELPYFVDTNHTQVGHTFGERLSNSVQKIFQKGYSRVIILGSDTPNISAQLIQKTNEALKAHNCVVGPSIDGGTYLLGLSKSTFSPSLFNSFNWKSSRLCEHLIEKLNGVSLSDELLDIDTVEDWSYFVKLNAEGSFVYQFLELLNAKVKINHYLESLYQSFKSYSLFLRGPPKMCLIY